VIVRRRALLGLWAIALCTSACGGDDRPTSDASVSTDGGGTVDAPGIGDDGGATDASETDSSPGTDAATDAGPLDPSQLTGVWEGVWMEDSGGPRETVPPGTFFVFEAGSTVRIGSCVAMGLSYTFDEAARTIVVEIPGSSPITWHVIELTATTFVFQEGPDVFGFERRASCG
jgi:hypothetical protein